MLKEHVKYFFAQMRWIVLKKNNRRTELREQQKILIPSGKIPKRFNTERPCTFWARTDQGGSILVFVVVPSNYYLQHNAELVRHRLRQIRDSKHVFRVWVWKEAVASLMEKPFMNLEEHLCTSKTKENVAKHAIILLGYSDYFEAYFSWNKKKEDWDSIHCDDTSHSYFYWKAWRRRDGLKVVFLSMRYTFWGDIAERFVNFLSLLFSLKILQVC
jgi:hypothetical protein